jgi:hypothetical protein
MYSFILFDIRAAAADAAFFLDRLTGAKLKTVQADTFTVYQKKYLSTGIPCTCGIGSV